jgi:DNA topoisomerase-3
LIHSLPDIAARPDMTADWESTLTRISEKNCRYQDFMQPLVTTLQDLIVQARQNRVSPMFRSLPSKPKAAAAGKRKRPPSKAAQTGE